MSISTATTNRALTVLGALTVAFVWFFFIVFWTDNADESSSLEKIIWGAIPALSTVAMVAGLRLREHSPRAAYWLIVAGAIGPMVWFWTVFVYAPLMIATIAVATNATPRKPTPLAQA